MLFLSNKLRGTSHDGDGHNPSASKQYQRTYPPKGETRPPVAGRLPPAAEAAEAVVVLLAVAVAVGLAVAVEVAEELAEMDPTAPSHLDEP